MSREFHKELHEAIAQLLVLLDLECPADGMLPDSVRGSDDGGDGTGC